MTHINNDDFLPTIEAAQAYIAAIRPAEYAQSRSHINGAVTQLSPYITHGFVTLPEIVIKVTTLYPLWVRHKFIFELGWREYFQHAWQHQGNAILQSLHQGLLPDQEYINVIPEDIRHACTGIKAIDMAVKTLYKTGMLHNHARLWLASYLIHFRKIYWKTGADWFISHLIDGDLGSNHLSWQWVAGTASSKPYLFNAEIVANCAPIEWHSFGSMIDQPLEAMRFIAHNKSPIPSKSCGNGIDEPILSAIPSESLLTLHQTIDTTNRDIWLVHPWALSNPPQDLPIGCLHLGFWPREYFDIWPWNEKRWNFVSTRMNQFTQFHLYINKLELKEKLSNARSVQTWANMHISHLLPAKVIQRQPLNLFKQIDQPCRSFSKWWNYVAHNINQISELPGVIHSR